MIKVIKIITLIIAFCCLYLIGLLFYYLVRESKVNKAITEGGKTMEKKGIEAPMFNNGTRVLRVDFNVIGQGTKVYTFEMPYDDEMNEEGNVKLATQNISRFIDEGKTIPVVSNDMFGLLSTRNITGITFENICVGQYTSENAGK